MSAYPDAVSPSSGSSSNSSEFSVLRVILLVIFALAMIWLALTVRLPDMDALGDQIDDFGF